MVSLLLAAVAVRMWALPGSITAGFTAAGRGVPALWGKVRNLHWTGSGVRYGAGPAVGIGVGVLAGPLIGVAAGLGAATVAGIAAWEIAARRERRVRAATTVAVRALAREVRSGTPSVPAIRLVGAAHPTAMKIFEELQILASAGDSGAKAAAAPGEVAGRLAAGWRLSARHGVPWAALLTQLAADLDREDAAEIDRSAQAAGPRLSGYLLAALPAFGLVLGSGMGAHPISVLLGTRVGQLLLLVGVALNCAGLRWTARIVRGGT